MPLVELGMVARSWGRQSALGQPLRPGTGGGRCPSGFGFTLKQLLETERKPAEPAIGGVPFIKTQTQQ